MRFLSRRLVMPNDLNFAGSLFGGRILEWIDEEAYIFASCQLDERSLVTKHIGAISFEASAYKGDVVEFGLDIKNVGRTSVSVTCVVRNKITKQTICVADEIDRKSTRLNSSHVRISYAVFCLKKKTKNNTT